MRSEDLTQIIRKYNDSVCNDVGTDSEELQVTSYLIGTEQVV